MWKQSVSKVIAAVFAILLTVNTSCRSSAATSQPRWSSAIASQLAFLTGGECRLLEWYCVGPYGEFNAHLNGKVGSEYITDLQVTFKALDAAGARVLIADALKDVVSAEVLGGIDARLKRGHDVLHLGSVWFEIRVYDDKLYDDTLADGRKVLGTSLNIHWD